MYLMMFDGVDVSFLDDIDLRLIFIDSKDLYFIWCNSVGFVEVCVEFGIIKDIFDLVGGVF